MSHIMNGRDDSVNIVLGDCFVCHFGGWVVEVSAQLMVFLHEARQLVCDCVQLGGDGHNA